MHLSSMQRSLTLGLRIVVSAGLGLVVGAALWAFVSRSIVGAMAGALGGILLGVVIWPLARVRSRETLGVAILMGMFTGALAGWYSPGCVTGEGMAAVVGAVFLAAATGTAAIRRSDGKTMLGTAVAGGLLGALLVGAFGLLVGIGGLVKGAPIGRVLALLGEYAEAGAVCGAIVGGLAGATIRTRNGQ